MTGITVDVGGNMDAPTPLESPISFSSADGVPEEHVMVGPGVHDLRSPAPMLLSPRHFRRDSSVEHQCLETASFLRTCGLCNRRLAPGRDIYMYRYHMVNSLVFFFKWRLTVVDFLFSSLH